MNNQEIGINSALTLTESNVVVYAVNDNVKDYFETLINGCGYQTVRVSKPQIQLNAIEPNDNQSFFPNNERKLALWANELAKELAKHLNPLLLIQSEIISEHYTRNSGVFLAELVWCDVIVPTIIASIDSESNDHHFIRRIRRTENNLINPIISVESEWFTQTPFTMTAYFILWDVISDRLKLKDALKASRIAVPISLEAEKILNISKNLIEAEMEELSHSIRHQYQNVIASLRLLLGAFTSGDITFGDLQETVEKLECWKENVVFTRLDELQKKWILKETEISSLVNVASSEISPQSGGQLKGKVIIIDDEYFPEKTTNSEQPKQFKNFGWEPVYRQILTNSRQFNFEITAFNSYESALDGIDRKLLAETEFIILDVNLGDASKSGLHLLHKIRLAHPFVPIIVMTSYDDAKICQFVFEWQSDAFFAKQLQDSWNRSSKKYYAKFVETIEFVLADHLNIRSLYNRFISKMNELHLIDDYIEKTEFEIPDHSNTVKSRVKDGVVSQMTHFFLLLRILNQRHRDDKVKISNLDENLNLLITLLLGAINAWLHFRRPAGSPLVKISQWLREPENNDEQINKKDFIYSIKDFEFLRHTHNAPILDLAEICKIAEEFFDLIEASVNNSSEIPDIPNRFLKDVKPLNSFPEDEVERLLKRAADKEKKQSLSHSLNSKMGAGAVLAGAYPERTADISDETNSENPFGLFEAKTRAAEFITFVEDLYENQNEKPIFIRVKDEFSVEPVVLTLVDDHGTENGWAYVTQLIHNNLLVNNITLKGPSDTTDYSNYIHNKLASCLFESDIFFVDLKMPRRIDSEPSVASGLEVIKLIKNLNPLAPIIVLSATSDSVNLRKAISNGAREFFVKEIPGGAPDELSEYAKQFSDLTAILRMTDSESSFIKSFQMVLPSLETLVEDIKSGEKENLFSERDGIKLKFNIYLKKWLGLRANSTKEEINIIIGDYLALLLRRIFFLHSLSKEKYLSTWLEYFSASSNINSVYLVHIQIWLSCGMLVEWIFNFVGFGLDIQSRSGTPGTNRSADETVAFYNFLTKEAFDLGKEIWTRRNQRGELKEKSPEQARIKSFQMVKDTAEFVKLINLNLTPLPGKTLPFGIITDLRKNLQKSEENGILRQNTNKTLADKEKMEKQYHSPNYPSGEKDFTQKLNKLEEEILMLKNELEASSNDPILVERHLLLKHLLKL